MKLLAGSILCVVASGAATAMPPGLPREALVLTLECEDEQRLTDAGGRDDVMPAETKQQDWFRARFALRPPEVETVDRARYDVALTGFEHETIRDGERSAQRWPKGTQTPEPIASVERSARSGKWRVHFRSNAAERVPPAIDEAFLARMLAALVSPEGMERRSGSPVVTRTGRWRRVGGVEYRATIHQVWTIGSADAEGFVPYGWHGEMTILHPDAPAGAKAAGRGTASELGSFDPNEGMYQHLAQSWDVEFATEGARIAWRHRCSTSVVPETLAPHAGGP